MLFCLPSIKLPQAENELLRQSLVLRMALLPSYTTKQKFMALSMVMYASESHEVLLFLKTSFHGNRDSSPY